MNSVMVSLIIPFYNAEKYLPVILPELILTCSENNWELIAVDDASTDGSESICKSFNIDPVSLIKNMGVAYARNTGAGRASGKILLFIDADILIKKIFLESLIYQLLAKPELASAGAVPGLQNLNNKIFSSNITASRASFLIQKINGIEMISATNFQSECGAIRKNIFTSVGMFNVKYKKSGMEEYELGHRLEKSSHRNVLFLNCTYATFHKNIWRRCSDLFYRTILWVPLFMKRKKAESSGLTGEKHEIISCLYTGFMFVSVLMIYDSFWFVAASIIFFIIFLFHEIKYFTFTCKNYSFLAGGAAIPGLLLMNLITDLGFLIGLIIFFRKKFSDD